MVFKDQRFPSLFVRCGVTDFVCLAPQAQQKHCRPLQISKSSTSNVEWNFSAFYVVHYEHGSVTSAFQVRPTDISTDLPSLMRDDREVTLPNY